MPTRPDRVAHVPESACAYPDIGVLDALSMQDNIKASNYRRCTLQYEIINLRVTAMRKLGYTEREIWETLNRLHQDERDLDLRSRELNIRERALQTREAEQQKYSPSSQVDWQCLNDCASRYSWHYCNSKCAYRTE
jgi:DNA-binding transcriptional MerR regulator